MVLGQPTDTSHTVTITLPLTPYQPEELLVISTVQPSNGNPILANFSRPGMQYSVTFDNLYADTLYIFTIRIVLCANNTVDVVQAATGSFMTLMTPSKLVYAPLCKHNYILCVYLYSNHSSPHYHGHYHHLHSNTLPANYCPSGWSLRWWLYCWNHHWFSDCSIDTCGHRCHHSVLLEQNKK